MAGWAREAGLEVELLEETSGRPSVLVRARGSGGGRTLLLCGHLDTVGVEGMSAPHEPRLEGDRMYGRGAYDMKAGVAAALVACREAAALGLAGDLVVAAVADEEHSSIGVQEALRAVEADAAIVTEPTQLLPLSAHRGFVWLEIEVRGQAEHGSRYDLGVDAIVKAGPILTELGRLDERLAAGARHELLGRGSVHASLISGGSDLATYPDRCTISVERRTLPGEDDIQGELEGVARELPRRRPRARGERAHAVGARRRSRRRSTIRSWARWSTPPSACWASGAALAALPSGPIRPSSPRPASPRCCSAPAARAPTHSRSG